MALPKRTLAWRLPGSWEQVNSVDISADGTRIVSGSSDIRFARGKRPSDDKALGPGGVRLWDAKTGRLVRSLGDPAEQVLSVAVSADGRWVAAGGGGRDGVGFVRMVDRDFVELSNLQRQLLFDEDDIANNLPKAVAAERALRRVNSSVQIDARVDLFHPHSRGVFIEK